MSLIGSQEHLAFLAVSFVLIVTPGPSVLLIVSQALHGGSRRGLVTVAGSTAGMMPPLALAVLGAGTLADALVDGLLWLRWAGVAWLLIQGLHELRPASAAGSRPAAHGPAWRAFVQGFAVSLLNPTTTPFFFAFLPQFIRTGEPALPQLMLLAATFLLMATVLDTGWALLAGRLGDVLARPRFIRLRGRIAGFLLIGCAVGLALARAG